MGWGRKERNGTLYVGKGKEEFVGKEKERQVGNVREEGREGVGGWGTTGKTQ